jgi:CheY-like chemotaxis protein
LIHLSNHHTHKVITVHEGNSLLSRDIVDDHMQTPLDIRMLHHMINKETASPYTLSLDNPKVLLIEDDEINRLTMEKILSRYQIDVKAFDSAESYLAEPKKHYDYGLIDINLPGMNGIELSKLMIKQDPSIKLIALTAYSISQLSLNEAHGFSEILLKPINIEQLLKVIHYQKTPVKFGKHLEPLAERFDYQYDLIIYTLDTFKSLIYAQLDALHQSVIDEDIDMIKHHAHTIKGSCLTVSLTEGAMICQEIMDYSQDAKEEAALLYQSLKDIVDQFVVAIPLLIKTLIERSESDA